MELKTFTNEDEFIKEAVAFIKNSCEEKNCKIALSGGSTPKAVYEALSRSKLDKFEFYQVDERFVPENHPNSNYKMLKESIKKEIHHFDTSLPAQESLKKYSKELPKTPFDLCILGIGTDGHTASLFPNSQALNEEKSAVAHTRKHEFTIDDRLTLTFPAIMTSKKLLVLLKGKEKQETLNRIQDPQSTIKEFPAKRLLEHPDLTILICNC